MVTSNCNRGGAALLICIFVVALTTLLVVSVLDIETMQMTASRNTIYHEQAVALAGAAVQHVFAELEQNPAWRVGLQNIEYPVGSGRTYSASVVDAAPGYVVITATGTVAPVTRRLLVTAEL
jgi:Tfp pilus assembly protein PilX